MCLPHPRYIILQFLFWSHQPQNCSIKLCVITLIQNYLSLCWYQNNFTVDISSVSMFTHSITASRFCIISYCHKMVYLQTLLLQSNLKFCKCIVLGPEKILEYGDICCCRVMEKMVILAILPPTLHYCCRKMGPSILL